MQLCGSLSILWHCLSLGLEWKLTFSSPVASAECSKFAGILSAVLSQHHLSIWNSSTGIPSPPLALFIVMLPKAHLTSHSKISGSRWVITPSVSILQKSNSVANKHEKVLTFIVVEVKWKSVSYIVHGILQVRILEWVAILFSRGSSQPRDRTQVSCIAGGFFTSSATREAQEYWSGEAIPSPADLPDSVFHKRRLGCLQG